MGNIAETNALCLEINQKIANISPVKNRLIEAHVKIRQDEPDEMEFLHSLFCQVGLPKRRTDKRTFERKNGNASLLIEAGSLYDGSDLVLQPLPYGAKPRLILAHITTEALRRKSNVVPVEASMTAFLRKLGMSATGGTKGSITLFKRQMKALAACRMTLGYCSNGQAHTISASPIKRFSAWLTPTKENKWPGEIALSLDFFESILNHAVPLDRRALGSLSHSATGLDVYVWLAHRLRRISRPQGIKLTWANLHSQFGQEYSSLMHFREKFLVVLKQVLLSYPEARVEVIRGGLLLKPSRPPIKRAFVLGY